jgi:hypothetical protein
MNTVNGVLALPDQPEGAPIRYIATDFAIKPTEFTGVKCRKCKCPTIFSSRAMVTDVPLRMFGLVPCRCGGCLKRFFVPFWRARKR